MWAKGAMIFAIRDYHGSPVRMHKACAERFDKEKPNTIATYKEGTHNDFQHYQPKIV